MEDPALLDLPSHHVLSAFAAIMLGTSPLEPSPQAREIATMSSRLTAPRPARPGDVEATRAYRSVYALAREHPPGPPASLGPAGVLRWAVLDATLRLPRRQRAALSLRYVCGLPPRAVARVLGVSKDRAAAIAVAGATRITGVVGRRVDVGRHLRAIGAMLAPAPMEGPAVATEARSVFKLLISTIGDAPQARGRAGPTPGTLVARPVYNVRAALEDHPPGLPRPATIAGGRKPRRTGLALAACVAALIVAAAYLPVALVAPPTPVPLAAIPVAPVADGLAAAAPQPALSVVVRSGDTLWSIATRFLGDGARWIALWRANAGRLMPDGTRFLDPDLIRPGWRLTLPRR